MTTAISTVNSVSFGSLVPGSRQMAIIAANMDGEPINEMDLTKVKNPAGGSTTWEIDNQGNVETSPEIVGVLVAIGKRGVLWPREEIGEEPPVIVTNDLVTGYRVSDKLGDIDPKALERYRTGDRRYDWHAISEGPEFGPKSGKGGVGKRVKESRTLAILRDGDVWPLLISVGPGSLGSFLPFLKKLPCFHYEAVIGLKLQKEKSKSGIGYSMIVPRLVGQLSEEQGEFVRKTYTENFKRMFSAVPNGATVAADTSTVDAEGQF
jgi:hypothetical protein